MQRLPNVYLSVFDRGENFDAMPSPVPDMSCNCKVADILGWFDITAYGAVGDATFNKTTGAWTGTDNGAAIVATIKAAVDFSATFAGRFGTVYFPPCATGKAYLVSTEVAVSLAAGNLVSSSALHLRLLGCGADSMIVVGVNDPTKYGINIDVHTGEWFQGIAENLCFMPQDALFVSGHAGCKAALRLFSSVGRWVVRDMHALGIWGKLAIFHLAGCNFSVSNFNDAGCSTGADPSGVGAFIYMDEPQVFKIDGVFSFSEFNYQGFDNGATSGAGLGLEYALVAVNASTDAAWGPTVGVVERIYGTTRGGYLVYAYPTTGAQRMASLVVRNFANRSSSNGAITAGYIDSLVIENGSWAAGSVYFLLDAYSVASTEVRNVIAQAGQTLPRVRMDTSCSTLELINTPLSSVSGSPCGVTLGDDNSTTAFITTGGVRTRVRRAQGTLVASTLGKPGATAGRIDQIGTGDDARLTSGIILDAGGADDFVRVVEQAGQQVAIKSDGSSVLTMADTLTSSGATAGFVKKTTSGGASTVGLAVGAATNVTGTLVNMVWQRGQY